MFSEKSSEWLAGRNLDDGISPEQILHADGDITLSAAEMEKTLQYPRSTCLVVDGNLSVDGHLSVDEMHALIVAGTVSCRSFWVGEGRFRAKELRVADAATFDCYSEDMYGFEVDKMSAKVWCTPRKDKPPGGAEINAEFVIEVSKLDESKLFSWIIDDSFDAVYSTLKSGNSIDDAWCLANKSLVANPELRVHLDPPKPEMFSRVRGLLEAIENGATTEEAELHGQKAIRVIHPDGAKQLTVLTPEELAAFEANRPD